MHIFVCILAVKDAKRSLGHMPVAVGFMCRDDETISETLPLGLHSEWWKRQSSMLFLKRNVHYMFFLPLVQVHEHSGH